MVKKTVIGLIGAAIAMSAAVAVAAPSQAADTNKPIKASTVAKHSSQANCWSIVGKGVYNLTSYVNRHPGGSAMITAICGRNGTSAFNSQHSGDGNATATLATFKVGRLVK